MVLRRQVRSGVDGTLGEDHVMSMYRLTPVNSATDQPDPRVIGERQCSWAPLLDPQKAEYSCVFAVLVWMLGLLRVWQG